MGLNNENRIHPRVLAGFETEVTLADGQRLSVTTANISLTGVMIDVNQRDFETILKKRINLEVPVEVDLKFKLPDQNETILLVTSHCRTVYVRRISQNQYFIGFKFLKINHRFERAIQEFIRHHLE